MAEVLPINGGSSLTIVGNRNERVVAILNRKDEIDSELAEIDSMIHTLHQERGELDAELAELTGVQRQLSLPNGNGGTRSQRTCKFKLPDGTICGSSEHDSRFHKEA
jgi:hypothetical protein